MGAVSAACLAEQGHFVVGVDSNPDKVQTIAAGQSPIAERGLDELIARNVASGALTATTSASEAIASTDLAFICVGTPSTPEGDLDLRFVERVCEEIGTALRPKNEHFTVVLRSTSLPGTTRGVVIPTLEASSGRIAGDSLGVCMHPEFLREGTAVSDFFDPPKVVIGSEDAEATEQLSSVVAHDSAPLVTCPFEVAELAKYVDNSWHATKVAFGNEVGRLAKSVGVNSHEVMRIFSLDTKLNISSAYLRPGFAFGGSCLPKDLRALNALTRRNGLDLPLLGSVLNSNTAHIEAALALVLARTSRSIALLGLSFKAGTDDLRESPIVDLAERLLGKGYALRIYDSNVSPNELVGANRTYVDEHLPHLGALMVPTLDDALQSADTVIIGNSAEEFEGVAERLDDGQTIIDLAALQAHAGRSEYESLCW